jgi:hypothetical protein
VNLPLRAIGGAGWNPGLVIDVGGLVTAEGSIICGTPQSGANKELQPSHKSGRSPSVSEVFGSAFESRWASIFNFTLTSALAPLTPQGGAY